MHVPPGGNVQIVILIDSDKFLLEIINFLLKS